MSVETTTRPDGTRRHKVRWREGGRNRARSFNRLKDARAFDERMHAMKAAGGLDIFIAGEQPLRAWAEEWWTRHKRRLRPRTQDVYSVQLDTRIIPRLGGYQLRQITPAVVRDFDSWMESTGAGQASRVKALTVLQSMLKHAVVDGIIRSNPVQAIDKPSQRRAREPVLIGVEKVEQIRRLMINGYERPSLKKKDQGRIVTTMPDVRSAMIVSVLAYAGLRPESEGVTLRWPQVRERSILVAASFKRGGRERSVRLLEPLANDLAEWRRVRPGTNLVFPTGAGEWDDAAWKNWQRRVFKPAAVAAGLPAHVRARDLRGSFATLLIFEGRNIAEVARQMGHSPAIALRDYITAIDEFDPSNPVPAEEQIRRAREETP